MSTVPLATNQARCSTIPMPVDTSSVLLHLHLPKTGGQTLQQLIYTHHSLRELTQVDSRFLLNGIYYYPRGIEEDAYPPDMWTDDPVQPPAETVNFIRQPNVRVVSGHFSFGLHRYLDRPTRYITVLRNPIDRVVSLYYFTRRRDHYRRAVARTDIRSTLHQLVKEISEGTLEQFVTTLKYKQVDNGQTRRLSGVEPPFGLCTQIMLEAAKQHLKEMFDAVGTLERFDQTVRVFAHRLGWNLSDLVTSTKIKRNVNPSRPKLEELPERILRLIRSYNEFDIELYRYANSLLDEAIAKLAHNLPNKPSALWKSRA